MAYMLLSASDQEALAYLTSKYSASEGNKTTVTMGRGLLANIKGMHPTPAVKSMCDKIVTAGNVGEKRQRARK
jgi:hypothetical protein